MPVDLTAKSVDELKTILKNHEVAQKTDAPCFVAALAELGRRTTAGLSLGRTVEIIAEAARNRQFITYKAIALQSGVKWNSANVAMPKHLLDVCQHGHRKGLPMLSAIVVSQTHLEDGGMDEATLDGFSKAAAALNYDVTDRAAFLKEQQAAVFSAAVEGKIR